MKRRAAAAVILVGGAAVVTYMETRQHERDRHALLRHATEMERALDEQMLADFGRLGRLENFAMKDVQVEITGDTATVRYRVQGTAIPRAQTDLRGHIHSAPPIPEPAPAGGEIQLQRVPGGWLMTGHRLIEQR